MSRDWTQEEFGITEDTPVSDSEKEINLLKEKLDIAVKALEKIGMVNTQRAIDSFAQCQIIAEVALAKIKEIK